jgi:hypothetical protein
LNLIRFFALAGLAFCLPNVAQGADLVTSADDAAMAPEMGAALDWQGFYVGTNLAYGMGSTAIGVENSFVYDGTGSEGGSVGGFAGYNFAFDDWVAGFELGGAWSDLNGHTELTTNGDTAKLKTSNDWNAAVSARLGRLVSPETLLFAGLGGKIYHGSIEATDQGGATIYSEDDQFFGVGTVTIGMETSLGGNWRGRMQYDADFLRTNSYGGLEITPTIGTAKLALIYAFGDAAPAPELTAAADRWTGFYAGFNLGQSGGVAALEYAYDDDAFRYDGFGSHGWTGGVSAGANMRVGDRFVLGVEGAYNRSSLETTIGSYDGSSYLAGRNTSWIDAKVKAGYLTSDTTMFYGFIGASQVSSDLQTVSNGDVVGETDLDTRNGLVAGAGVETWLNDSISVRGEYAYTALEAYDIAGNAPGGAQLDMQQNQQTATIGVLYHF